MRIPRLVLVTFAGCLAPGCVELTQAAPPARSALPAVHAVAAPAAERPFVGLEVEESIAGLLESMDFLEGLLVVSVAPGSPAESAGIRPGDRLAAADGVPLSRVDQWHAVLDAAAPGAPLALSVERDRGLADVEVHVERRGGGALPERHRFAERLRGRLIAESAVADVGGAARAAARVTELLPESPLAGAGIVPGDAIIALDDRPVRGAADLAARLAAAPFGADVTFDVVTAGGRRREVDVTLWEPERHLTGLRVPILFTFARELERDRTEFALVDLWVIALYDYLRAGHTVRHRVLRFFVFETGTGELTEEPPTDPPGEAP